MTERLQDRLLALALGAPTWTVLGIAAWLTPDDRGFGTHQQLGLGTCSFMKATGWACPMCGMTTSFTHGAHLDLLGALAAQPFGTLLFLATVAGAGISLVELADPRGRWRRIIGWILDREVAVALLFLGGLLSAWAYKAWTLGPIG